MKEYKVTYIDKDIDEKVVTVLALTREQAIRNVWDSFGIYIKIVRIDQMAVVANSSISIGKIKSGKDGIPGRDGSTYYTWIKYADTPTTGMSDSPEGKSYIGLAYNKPTSQESTNYRDWEGLVS